MADDVETAAAQQAGHDHWYCRRFTRYQRSQACGAAPGRAGQLVGDDCGRRADRTVLYRTDPVDRGATPGDQGVDPASVSRQTPPFDRRCTQSRPGLLRGHPWRCHRPEGWLLRHCRLYRKARLRCRRADRSALGRLCPLIAQYGYRSCWSTPICSYQGQVLGTFALYSYQKGLPSEEHNELISMAAHLAGIAIERRQSEERIQFMAHHDALTGLPNRLLFDARVASALQEARQNDQWVALAFLDLDNFKLINDSLGHHSGDQLLRIVADRMRTCVRRSDMIVRVGGDEFIIMLTGLPAEREVVLTRFEKIRSAIAAPMMLSGHSLQITCSMGVVCYPEHGATAVELLANADSAMYRAKEIGRNNLQLFSAEMAAKAHEKLLRHEELRDAVARQEFVLHYQPQLNLETGRMFAAESLVRWQHPERGMVSPGEFIPLAEETGLIVAIGDWVLNEACRQNKAWQDAGLPPIVISVNVSARQFREQDWVCRVSAALRESGLEARYLELELTESLIMQDVPAAIATMHELEALGVQLAIDDFGTGYSSLSALKSFPVSRLKIDRSFVQDIPADEDDMAITGAIISLAQKLHMRVIAEGVETQAQLDFLRISGCDEIQGYFFSKPLRAEAFEGMFAAEPGSVATAGSEAA
ncbi:EAL domain-containing protein [Rhizobium sp. 32-5/1]|uniref:EAL domain-containing protein n=1 Tax=Rhizobium sp. 32-5/1 TaxID=3019602 RepID=UPI0032B8072E